MIIAITVIFIALRGDSGRQPFKANFCIRFDGSMQPRPFFMRADRKQVTFGTCRSSSLSSSTSSTGWLLIAQSETSPVHSSDFFFSVGLKLPQFQDQSAVGRRHKDERELFCFCFLSEVRCSEGRHGGAVRKRVSKMNGWKKMLRCVNDGFCC